MIFIRIEHIYETHRFEERPYLTAEVVEDDKMQLGIGYQK